MNSKKQTRILPEANFCSHHASKGELSVKYFNRFNNNILIKTSLVNKTVIENGEVLETERGNSNCSSNSKQKEKLIQNL